MADKSASGLLPDASGMLPVASDSEGENEGSSHVRASKGAPTKVVITKALLKTFKPAQGAAEAFLWDATVTGLALRAYASGRKVWTLQYRDQAGRTRRIGIGDAKSIAPEDAREAARAQLTQKALGKDPAKARQANRQGERFEGLVETYLYRQRTHARESTFDQLSRNLGKYAAPLNHEPIASISRADIHCLHTSLTKTAGAVQANRVLAALSAMFAWAMRAGFAESNPAALVPKNAEKARERVLGDDELAALWRATDGGGDYARIVRLLLLTGCRRDEIGSLRWVEVEVEGARLILPPARTKTSVIHEVPLTKLALAQLPEWTEGREFVFGRGEGWGGWSRAKARLDAALRKAGEWEQWGLHDLRRTMSTRLNEAGVDPHVVEALLGHAGAKSGVAGVYNKAAYRQQKRDAAELWTHIVADIADFPQ